MFTPAELSSAQSRLVTGKLTQVDIDKLVTAFRRVFADLEVEYNYQFESKLSELDDTGNQKQRCAQIAACLVKMEGLGFGVSFFTTNTKSNLNYSEEDDYIQYVLFAFSKIYPIPAEFAKYSIQRSVILRKGRKGSRGSLSSSTRITREF